MHLIYHCNTEMPGTECDNRARDIDPQCRDCLHSDKKPNAYRQKWVTLMNPAVFGPVFPYKERVK